MIDMETLIQIITIVLTIIIGLVVGSFLNVVIYRLPNDMSLAFPPSHCPKCNHPIKWYDNVPLLSYIILRGKCRHCHEHISIRYPLVELTNTLLWFVSLMMFTNFIIPTNPMNWLKFIVSCIICSTLLCIFFTDLDHMEIPEIFQLILLVCGLVLLLEDVSFNTILLKVTGFIGAGLLFIITNFIYKLIRKRDGIGFGDVELMACAGLILGGYKVMFALLISCIAGAFILITLNFIKKNGDRNKEYPFAIFLVPGILIALFIGNYVVDWYLKLLGVN